ncbi:MAG: sigma-E factor negative regulatory protein [Rhodocyclaceae bacterium]|jgi:sigma-E factor negative regulatory protein RseA|nr:sigma-E factor negative regulatory protein [Rhodocyclaceae bacterium]
MKSQLPELSALLDGELEPHEVRSTLKAAVREPELRENWRAYVLIGDQLRQESTGTRDLTACVMAKVHAEPVVLAPRKLQPIGRSHPGLALAASVAGVAVAGWLAMAGNSQFSPAETRLAAVTSTSAAAPAVEHLILPAPTIVADVTPNLASAQTLERVADENTLQSQGSTMAAARGDMSEYLLAHHTQSSTFRLGNNAGHVRTVTMTDRPARP